MTHLLPDFMTVNVLRFVTRFPEGATVTAIAEADYQFIKCSFITQGRKKW